MKTIVIHPMSNRAALATVRKIAAPVSKTFRDKRNDYKRKPKFGNDW